MADIRFDQDYIQSWDGVMAYARMQRLAADPKATDAQKLVAVAEFMDGAVANIDEVIAEMGGGNVPAEQVFAAISAAMAEAQPKN